MYGVSVCVCVWHCWPFGPSAASFGFLPRHACGLFRLCVCRAAPRLASPAPNTHINLPIPRSGLSIGRHTPTTSRASVPRIDSPQVVQYKYTLIAQTTTQHNVTQSSQPESIPLPIPPCSALPHLFTPSIEIRQSYIEPILPARPLSFLLTSMQVPPPAELCL